MSCLARLCLLLDLLSWMQDRLHPVLMLAAGIMPPPGYAQQQPAFAQRPHRPDQDQSVRLPRGPKENRGLVVAVVWRAVRAVVAVKVSVHDGACAHAGMLTMAFLWRQEGHVTRGVAAGLSWSVAGQRSCRLRLRMLSFPLYFFLRFSLGEGGGGGGGEAADKPEDARMWYYA